MKHLWYGVNVSGKKIKCSSLKHLEHHIYSFYIASTFWRYMTWGPFKAACSDSFPKYNQMQKKEAKITPHLGI